MLKKPSRKLQLIVIASMVAVIVAVNLGWLYEVTGYILLAAGLVVLVANQFMSNDANTAANGPQPSGEDKNESELKDTIIDHVDRAIVVCSADGVVRFANARARTLFKAPALVGMNLHHVALSPGFTALVDEALHTHAKSPISRELAVDYPDQLNLRVQALRVADDAVALWIADVSEIRRLENVRRDFVANVSHELRTPMAAMRAMAETIEDDPGLTTADRDRYLDKIIAEVDRLTLLSDDLLTLASAEAKPAEQSEIDLAEIARYAVQQMEQPASTKGLTLEIDAPKSLVALGDRPRVIQVAMNLLQNAIRYTNTGGAKVRVYEDGPHAVLEVQDTGIGIGAEHLPRIFERFYRVDAARSRETGGTGLGLAIVRHITESLGGKVEIDSEPGRGSTFRVRLPL